MHCFIWLFCTIAGMASPHFASLKTMLSLILPRDWCMILPLWIKVILGFTTHKHRCNDRYVIQRFWRISWICLYLKNKGEILESSLYKSSRVVPRVTLVPFLKSQVQNLKNRFFASFAMFSGEKLVACSEFFFFQFSSDFSTRGTKWKLF